MSESDLEYYGGRAAVERELARTSRDESVAAIHAQLAMRYEQMARQVDVEGIAQAIAVERFNHGDAHPLSL